jgi:Lon protease-like protein
MTETAPESSDDIRVLPVFPLPQTVFFPRTFLPLHIFEERYKAMVRDAAEGTGLIVITRSLGEGFEPVGTIGRVRQLQPLEDGRFNMVVEGLQRVSITEVPRDTPYRQVRAKACPEHLEEDDLEAAENAKLEVLGTLGILVSIARGEAPLVLDQEQPFEVVINKACAGLPIPAVLRQKLLDEGNLMERYRRLSKHLDAVIESISREGSSEQSGDTAPN